MQQLKELKETREKQRQEEESREQANEDIRWSFDAAFKEIEESKKDGKIMAVELTVKKEAKANAGVERADDDDFDDFETKTKYITRKKYYEEYMKGNKVLNERSKPEPITVKENMKLYESALMELFQEYRVALKKDIATRTGKASGVSFSEWLTKNVANSFDLSSNAIKRLDYAVGTRQAWYDNPSNKDAYEKEKFRLYDFYFERKWIRDVEDDFTLFSEEQCKFRNWEETIERGSYYRLTWWGRINPLRRLFSDLCPLRDMIFSRDSFINQRDVDMAVDTMALVNALLLTLPFGFIGNLQNQQWDNMVAARIGCTFCNCSDFDISYVVVTLTDAIMALIYLTTGSLVFTLLYYLCRPRTAADSEKDDMYTLHYYLNPKMKFLQFGRPKAKEGAAGAKAANDVEGGKTKKVFPCIMDGDELDPYSKRQRHEMRDNPVANFLYGDYAKVKRDTRRKRKDWNWRGNTDVTYADICRYRFRAWFRRGKVLLFLIFIGTTFSIGLVLTVGNLFFEYFMMPTPVSGNFDYCATRVAHYTQFTYWIAIEFALVVASFLIAV